jgi:hypothetical protein
MSDSACETELPTMPDCVWHRALDTSLDLPHNLPELNQQEALDQPRYLVQSRSVVVLEGWPAPRLKKSVLR